MDILTAAFLALAAPALSEDVYISPAVRALGQKHGPVPSAAFENDLDALAKSGDRSAAVMLGEMLMRADRSGGRDLSRACDFAELGSPHPEGLHNLATCYFLGSGRPRDFVKARDFYRQAAEQGFAKSASAYGNMLISGQGGPKYVARGLDLCRRAADAGIADAQTDYGGYLLTDTYTSRNATEARRYLTLAATKGQANAAFLLGKIYWNGDGVEKSIPEAAIWWLKAFDGGRADAAFLIGNAAMKIVVEGAKTERRAPTAAIEQAKKWLAIAAQQDPSPEKRDHARETLALLEQLLSERR